ncbi:hypothetical protein PIB30_106607 [Stylosanthes scabra]|uniref:Uncharacterized protein n=1 Tax=Stylosanthes scabra TaxID=79078 RepID=A0ABU6T183_9FABA|nr:hypothetical protein [Stylosanthes scabra]
MMNFPMNQNTEMPISIFPLGRTPGISNITTKGSFQEEVTPEVIGAGEFVPKYDIFGELQKPQDWEMGQSRDANVMIGTPVFSVSESMEQGTIQNQHLNTFVADN